MKTIWKWDLEREVKLEMPDESKILCIQTQGGRPMIWAMVDTEKPRVHRTFRIYGTGFSLPDNPGDYIGTFLVENDAFVFHVFEVTTS
jgi:hypothetical protein